MFCHTRGLLLLLWWLSSSEEADGLVSISPDPRVLLLSSLLILFFVSILSFLSFLSQIVGDNFC